MAETEGSTREGWPLVRTVVIRYRRVETDRSSRTMNRPLADRPAETRYNGPYQCTAGGKYGAGQASRRCGT